MTLVLLVFGCLVLSFFFSGMETGVLLLNRARVRHLKERGSRGAGILLNFMQHPGHLSSTVLVGNTLVNGTATVLVAQAYLAMGGPLAAIGATAVFAFVLWFYGDLVPKTLFRRFPNRLTTRLAPVLLVTNIILLPIVQCFNFLSQWVVRAMGGRISSRQMFVTRDELKLMAREGDQGIPLTGEQRNLVASILDSQNAAARDIMRPRAEVKTVKKSSSDAERLSIAALTGFTRLPVEADGAVGPACWENLWVAYDSLFLQESRLRNPPRIEAGTHIEEILATLRANRSPLAFVKDRDGNDIGIISVEDVLRRYVGRIDL